MTSFQDAPDESIEHDEKMELRSTMTSYHDAPDEWMEDDEAMEERSSTFSFFFKNKIIPNLFCKPIEIRSEGIKPKKRKTKYI